MNCENIIEIDDTARVVWDYDEDSENPRDWSNLGKMHIRSHRRYKFAQEMPEWEFDLDEDDEEAKERNADILNRYHVFSVDCYEHSGVCFSLSGTGHQCQWDTAKGAWIVAIPKKYACYDCREVSESKHADKGTCEVTYEEAEKIARGQLESYNAWLNGEVYYCEFQTKVELFRNDGTAYGSEWETAESCGGYYDLKDFAECIPKEYREKYLKNV